MQIPTFAIFFFNPATLFVRFLIVEIRLWIVENLSSVVASSAPLAERSK
jgi:hypothetical protein